MKRVMLSLPILAILLVFGLRMLSDSDEADNEPEVSNESSTGHKLPEKSLKAANGEAVSSPLASTGSTSQEAERNAPFPNKQSAITPKVEFKRDPFFVSARSKFMHPKNPSNDEHLQAKAQTQLEKSVLANSQYSFVTDIVRIAKEEVRFGFTLDISNNSYAYRACVADESRGFAEPNFGFSGPLSTAFGIVGDALRTVAPDLNPNHHEGTFEQFVLEFPIVDIIGNRPSTATLFHFRENEVTKKWEWKKLSTFAFWPLFMDSDETHSSRISCKWNLLLKYL
ncbi:MAG: hypothetical protein ACOYLH_12735 [Flavobacteriales bacterium]